MNYIVREEDRLRAFYHAREKGIKTKIYENGIWGPEQAVIRGARENFTLTAGRGAHGAPALRLFCQDERGDAVFAEMSADGTWKRRLVLKNPAEKPHKLLPHPIITRCGVSVIYNIPSSEDCVNSQYLVIRNLDKHGRWSPASRIDAFYPMGGVPYVALDFSDARVLVFYQARADESLLVCREVTPWQAGPRRVAHSGALFVADASFLAFDDAVHFLFIACGESANRLIYRKKENNFAEAITLCEGQGLESCVLGRVGGKLRAAFVADGQPYECVSEDNGNTFTRPDRYRAKFSQSVKKAGFVNLTREPGGGLFLRQVYVDAYRPWDAQMIPELCEDYYPRF